MRYAATIAALVLTVVVSACAGTPQEEFTRADAEAIRKNTADFTAAFNAKEVDKLVDFYGENAVLMPPNKPLLRGREVLKSYYDDQVTRGELTMNVDEVSGHGPIAFESGTYAMALADGNRDRGKYIRVLRSQNGNWRTEKIIWSSDLPKQPAAAAD